MTHKDAVIASIVERLRVYMTTVEANQNCGSITIEIHRGPDGWRKAHVQLSENWPIEK